MDEYNKLSKPWETSTADDLKKIKGVCLDIDDTLSSHGKLTSEAFEALWNLKKAGFAVVPITGRPAGWCDHFARFWPVDAVVGENGAFVFFVKDQVRRRLDTPTEDSSEVLKKKLEDLAVLVKKNFPFAKWASDQAYREYDLAIDICEDVPSWSTKEIDALLQLCHEQGAHAKLSSIHVNVWFGNYDKRKGFEYWLNSGAPGCSLEKVPQWEEWLFIGDSPNDEPLFASFEVSVGVANIKNYLNRLKFPPSWITQHESGKGFSEMVEHLIRLKGYY